MVKHNLKYAYFDILQLKHFQKGTKQYKKLFIKIKNAVAPYAVQDLRKNIVADGASQIKKMHKISYIFSFFFLGLVAACIIACFIIDESNYISDYPYIEICMAIMGFCLVTAIGFVFIANHYVAEYISYLIDHFEPDCQGLSDEQIKKIIDCEQMDIPGIDEATLCGCYNCLKLFHMSKEKINNENYFCPHCLSFKIVADSSILNKTFLKQMHNFWMIDIEQPFISHPEAIETCAVNSDYNIDIFENNGVYTYSIINRRFKDYDDKCHIYWAPISNEYKSIFDTKEKAIKEAKYAIEKLCGKNCCTE